MNIDRLAIYFIADGYRNDKQESSLCQLCGCYGIKSWNWKERETAVAIPKVSNLYSLIKIIAK